MNAVIDLLETLSGSILPIALILFGLTGLILFSWLAIRNKINKSLFGGSNMTLNSRNESQSNAMQTVSNLKMEWAAKRNYRDTLAAGPIINGTFKGWFEEEKKLLNAFVTAKQKVIDNLKKNDKEYPADKRRYLEIVNESERKPHSWVIYIGLFLLMAVEATGFSLIFADRLSDTASAQAIQQYAILISIVIAALALFFADRVGKAVYKQGYANTAHLHAPGQSLQRTSAGRSLGLDDLMVDDQDHQSLRIINRSDYVHNAAAKAKQHNKVIPKFPSILFAYIACIALFGLLIGGVRIDQINEYYAKEAQKQVTLNLAETGSNKTESLAVPPGVSMGKSESSEAITQEALDIEKRGKQLAIGVFVMIFFLAQTLGVVLAAVRGFASNDGEKAYRAIRDFIRLHGDLSREQWNLKLQAELDETDRYAQETLTGWQLGLQTAFHAKAIPVPNPDYFLQCVSDFSQRTYATYQIISAKAASSAHMHSTLETPVVVSAAPPMPVAMAPIDPPVQLPNPVVAAALTAPVEVEYFVSSAGGAEKVERSTLADLQNQILSGRIVDLSLLNVRYAGQPGRYAPWTEFAKGGTKE